LAIAKSVLHLYPVYDTVRSRLGSLHTVWMLIVIGLAGYEAYAGTQSDPLPTPEYSRDHAAGRDSRRSGHGIGVDAERKL
jgi:hypothetical protein